MTFPHEMLRYLKPNWDSYGAPAIDGRCISKAFELWRQLSGEWQVVPCNDGGVQLEQHGDLDIEITISPRVPHETTERSPNCERHGQIVETGCPDCERALGRLEDRS